MIAIDTSALIAGLFREPEAINYSALIQAHGHVLVRMPTAMEFYMVALGQAGPEVAIMVRTGPFELVPFGREHLAVASRAFRRYGKGIDSKARLNFGDCMAYAVASVAGCRLLFKGRDFIHTDIPRVA